MGFEVNALAKALDERWQWAVDTLADWVACDSVLGNESDAQEYIAGVYCDLGLTVITEPVDVTAIRGLPGFSPADWSYEGRVNVVGLHDPREHRARSLILNNHVDVVSPGPVELWDSPPFKPLVREDEEDGETWMVGRGTGDMKGGAIAALWAFAALRDMGLEPASPVMFQSVIEEECTGNGTLALCAAGYGADGCVIPEPFDETVLLRQVGVLWFQVRILGRTTHVLETGRGVNAIEKSWLIIEAMRALEAELNRPKNIPAAYAEVPHPLNLNVGIISGGDWASTVAGECTTHFRLGLFPEQACEDLMEMIERRVAEVAAKDPWLCRFPPTVEYNGFRAEGFEISDGDPLVRALARAHRSLRRTGPEMLSATCTTDARFFNLYYGIPATCYGPRARNIHGANERVSVHSMMRVAEVLATFIEDWTGLRDRGPLERRRTHGK